MEDHQKRISVLWLKLMEGYGHKFTSSMGEEPNDTWIDGLADLSHESFLKGIYGLMASTDAWPPSLPEFRRWCLDIKDPKEARAAAIEEWEVTGRGKDKYNPNNAGRTYDQLERDRRAFIESRVAEATMYEVNQRRLRHHQEPITDPMRICRDEDYN